LLSLDSFFLIPEEAQIVGLLVSKEKIMYYFCPINGFGSILGNIKKTHLVTRPRLNRHFQTKSFFFPTRKNSSSEKKKVLKQLLRRKMGRLIFSEKDLVLN
jgi:uncharacterized protein (DUF2225 family)